MKSYDKTSITKKFQVEMAISCKGAKLQKWEVKVYYLTSLHISKHEFYAN